MHNSDQFYLSKFSQNSDYDSFFEEDYFQDIDLDPELTQFMDMPDFDGKDELFWDEI
jgi:hypothetical protein